MNLNIFAEFPTLDAHAPEGYQVEFLGHISKCEYQVRAATGGNAVRPAIDHEIFEWIAILESVIAARSSFTMVDLGAGYGRWTARAACALRLKRSELQSRFVAVEAEPTHFRWIKEHFIINKIDLADCTLVNAPVTGRNETVPFTVGHPSKWYGQAVLPSADYGFGDWPDAKVVSMQSTTIAALIEKLNAVDLIDMDIQGAELPCIENSIEVLNKKVKRLFISTHSDEIHSRLNVMLATCGWSNEVSHSPLQEHDTQFGSIQFVDGVQYWVNRAPPIQHQ